jgi:hypothetical protein
MRSCLDRFKILSELLKDCFNSSILLIFFLIPLMYFSGNKQTYKEILV